MGHINKFRQNITRPEGLSESFLMEICKMMPSPTGTGVIIPKTCNFAFNNEFNETDHLVPLKISTLTEIVSP